MFYFERKTAVFTFLVFFTVMVFFSGTASTSHASFLDVIRAFVTINPLALEVSAPRDVEIGRAFKIEAKAINKGEVKIENVTGKIFLPAELSLSGKSEIKKIGTIRAGREKKILWQVKGETIGRYIVTVSIDGVVGGDSVITEKTRGVEIIEKTPPGRSGNAFQAMFTFLRQLFQK